MMDELISKVTQKTGLSPEQAKSAVESVLDFLKTRLPATLASSLDSITSGASSAGETGSGLLASAAAKVGSVFGKD